MDGSHLPPLAHLHMGVVMRASLKNDPRDSWEGRLTSFRSAGTAGAVAA